MKVTSVKTQKVKAKEQTIFQFLDKNLKNLEDGSVLAITSKVISLCEGRVVPAHGIDRDELVKKEADLYLPRRFSQWNFELTITERTLVMSAGIDESNVDGDNYVLWPKNPQESAQKIWEYLKQKHNLENLGVIITDSTCTPLRWGTTGVAIAYCGLKPKNSYIGQPDLFGRELKVSQSNIAGGLAAAAVLCMGEGDEQTPLAVISDVSFVHFQNRPPTKAELDEYFVMDMETDVFYPLLNSVDWHKGGRE
jgi:putative folate metabolism gamma-glutamate ligase